MIGFFNDIMSELRWQAPLGRMSLKKDVLLTQWSQIKVQILLIRFFQIFHPINYFKNLFLVSKLGVRIITL